MNQTPQKNREKDRQGNWDDYIKSYYEKPSSFRTCSGYDVK